MIPAGEVVRQFCQAVQKRDLRRVQSAFDGRLFAAMFSGGSKR